MRPGLAAAAGGILLCMSGCSTPPTERAEAAVEEKTLSEQGSPSTRWVTEVLLLFQDEGMREHRERLVLGLIDVLIADARRYQVSYAGIQHGSPPFEELELRSILFEHPEFWAKRSDDLLGLGIQDASR